MAMENPIKSMMPKDTQGPGMGGELREKLRMQKEASDSMKTPAPVVAPAKPVTPSPADKVNPSGKYGDKPGENRMDVREMVKPLGQMHSGGTVPKTGPYIMKAGEKVLTPEQHHKLHAAMGLAASALSHEADKEPEAPKPLREMHIRELHSGGFHVSKHDGMGKMTEHGAGDAGGIHEHVEDHFGTPNDGEHESENEMDESPGVVAIQKELGFKK